MLHGRELPAVVDDRLELAVAQTVGVSLSHPICKRILRQIVGGLVMVPGLGRLAIVTLAGPAFGQIPAAFCAVRGNIGQDSDFLSYLASPPFKFWAASFASFAASLFFFWYTRACALRFSRLAALYAR